MWLSHPISGCLCFYIWEALVDFIVRGTQLFRSLEWLLDVGIISASITELVFLLLGNSVEEVRILKLLRICRVMRLIRFIRKAPSLRELRKLMMMFASVIRTLAWSFLFCFIAMTLWSMISVELIHPIILELAEQGTWNECDTCSESFATIMQSNLTFLKTLLAGDSWGQVAVSSDEKKQPLTIIIFCWSPCLHRLWHPKSDCSCPLWMPQWSKGRKISPLWQLIWIMNWNQIWNSWAECFWLGFVSFMICFRYFRLWGSWFSFLNGKRFKHHQAIDFFNYLKPLLSWPMKTRFVFIKIDFQIPKDPCMYI